MNKKIKFLGGIIGLILGLVGCGNGGGNDTTTTSSINTSTTTTVKTLESPYLRKIGENGAVLNANATNWKMVELVEVGLLVNNTSYTESLKTYSYDEAKSYCTNLKSAGYSDFRVPTSSELKIILKLSSFSAVEKSYFINYYNDYTGDGVKYPIQFGKIWTSDVIGIFYYYKYLTFKQNSGYLVRNAYDLDGASKLKSFCVRKW